MYTPPPIGAPNSMMDLRARLRPMGIGDILDETFRLYRANFALFVATVAIVEVPIQIINLILQLTIVGSTQSLTSISRSAGTNGGLTQAQVNSLISFVVAVGSLGIISTVVTLIGLVIMSAALAVVISNRYLNRPTTVGEAYRAAVNHLGSLILAILWVGIRLAALPIAIAIIVVITALAHLAAIGIIIAILGAIAAIALYIYFGVAWALISQTIMLENSSGAGASGRSRQLVTGYWWKTLGLVLVTAILVAIVAGIPSAVISGVVGSFTSLTTRTLISGIVGGIATVLVRPIQTAATTLLFYDLKIRKEAFDLEAMAQQAGITAPAPSTWQ